MENAGQPNPSQDVFIVGAGRAGVVLAKALMRTGHKILGTWNRTAGAAAHVRSITGSTAFHGRIPQVARSASVILMCVTDDSMPSMARQLVKDGVIGPGQVVAHVAGALDSAVLAPAKNAGAAVGSMHPVASFSPDASLPVGTHFAVEGDAIALPVLRKLVEDVGGVPLTIDPGFKPRYHAALVFASNYMVALSGIAMDMLRQSGLSEDDALAILGPLVEGTARNIAREGVTDSLTGPVTRGDLNTVKVHLQALAKDEELANLYAVLGRRAVRLAEKQGLDANHAQAIVELLSKPRG